MSFREYFLDANAHLPLNNKALQAYVEFCKSSGGHGHPSSPSIAGRQAAVALEQARAKIANLIGAKKPGNIVFTSSCTQACEWGLEMFFQKKLPPGTTFTGIYESDVARSPAEHPAARDAFDVLTEEFAENPTVLPIDANGLVSTEVGADKTCCIHVQNEIGVIQPIQDLKCRYLFSDMSQSLGKIPVDVGVLGVDIAVFGAHKFGGPGGFGFIYLQDTSDWESFGAGSRYFLDRPGTPDVAAAVATAAALEDAIATLEERTARMTEFQLVLERGLENMDFEIVGKGAPRVPSTTFVKVPGKGLLSVMKLGEKFGIHIGLGSACGSLHTGESPLMEAIGCGGNVHDFMRISQFGEYGEKDAFHFLACLEKCL